MISSLSRAGLRIESRPIKSKIDFSAGGNVMLVSCTPFGTEIVVRSNTGVSLITVSFFEYNSIQNFYNSPTFFLNNCKYTDDITDA